MMHDARRGRHVKHSIGAAAMAGLLTITAIAAAILCFTAAVNAAEPSPAFALDRTIELQGVMGRIDHLAIDLGRKRLFVAELGNGTLDVVDLMSGTVSHRIHGLSEPQGVAYAPAVDVLAVANAGDGSVHLFRGADLAPAGVIELGGDADNVRLDARTGNLVVGYGNGGLAVIDPAKAMLVRRIPLPAHPEGFQLDADARRAFVNVPDARQIAVVDLDTGRQIATWRASDLRANFPMALDVSRAMLAVVFRNPPRLAIFDTNTGRATATLAACGDADDVFLDLKRRRIYVSCGAGNVDGWQREGSTYRQLSALKTAPGARTSLFVPDLDRLYVAARAGFVGTSANAAILALKPLE